MKVRALFAQVEADAKCKANIIEAAVGVIIILLRFLNENGSEITQIIYVLIILLYFQAAETHFAYFKTQQAHRSRKKYIVFILLFLS